jgi:hypothetical protein
MLQVHLPLGNIQSKKILVIEMKALPQKTNLILLLKGLQHWKGIHHLQMGEDLLKGLKDWKGTHH